MLIFHTTTSENAEQIRLDGFEDPKEKVVGGRVCAPTEEGTYFADQTMIDNSLDSGASFYFQIEIPENIIEEYEETDEANETVCYREWVIPAEIVNEYFIDKNIYNLEK